MNTILGAIGAWIVADGIISIRLYLHAKGEDGKRLQNWRYDHSIRLIRILCGLVVIIIGAVYECK